MAERITRRHLLGAAGATGAWLAWAAAGNSAHAEWASPSFPGDPFTLGVASGEPRSDGVVLWTKLAPDPLAPDGLGGMPSRVVPVRWQVATDTAFRQVVATGIERATPELGHSVHAEVTGLDPAREYYYRFRAGPEVSPVGRTRTAPREHSDYDALTFALACCQNYAAGHYTAYEHLAAQDVDLVVFVGDYIYEGPGQGSIGRAHLPPREIVSLADYRVRHGQYRSDPSLQAAHARAPWLVVFDDHEVDNNWADETPSGDQPVEEFLRRRAAAFQAYYEFMPLRRFSEPDGIDIQLYRRVDWGRLASFHILDTRQYRDPYACGAEFSTCPEAFDPNRSILGFEQEDWLVDGLRRSRARWDFITQQGAFVRRLIDRSGELMLKMDAWDGYVGSQQRVTRGWVDAGVRNPVVLSGDVHAHWACDLKLDYDSPDAPVVGSELITTSITSGGTGEDWVPGVHPAFEFNPHLRFYTNLRGYLLNTVTRDGLQADYHCVRDVLAPGAEVFRRASFVIEDGVRGLRQTYDGPSPTASTTAPRFTDEERRRAIDALIAWESDDEQVGV
ncbi:alkaline phosphatase D family protein [Jiangella asiatica]|uniref:Alkaline phosphatase n=1 Tax=Jiangella asiatica TaxID=2530372 RepID=A0A4V2Z333_9ACTN|nr:alkaline phosphatase D family protein [Jiangella asiatica]TDE11218.1 alkaline phosphatase [Jiangella asiatica]